MQDGRHNPSATDTQQQGLDLCTQLSKQLQGQMVHYKETGKQLTAIGEQLGKASEGLTCLNEQLQAAPASSQAEILSKVGHETGLAATLQETRCAVAVSIFCLVSLVVPAADCG